jgi:hypothetical protein
MLYLHDVWVNWFEGEENGYNVCEFHEWRKDDFIEILDQVPVIMVEPKLFSYIENNLADLPNALLDDIHNKSFVRKNNERTSIEYCFITTDGSRVIVVNTLTYQIPVRKSRLIPRQEAMVLEMKEQLELTHYYIPNCIENKEYHILSPSPDLMSGLTRKERQLKQLLFMALDQLHTTGNVAEVRYWYTECFPKKYVEIQMMDFDEAWDALYDEVQSGWSDMHYHLCERLIKGQPFFEKVWELEEGTQVN